MAAGRAVAAGRRGDLDRRLARRLQVRRVPRGEPPRRTAARQALGAGHRRDDRPQPRQQRATRRVEVVAVMVVADQDGVDRAELVGRDRRSGDLARRRAPAEEVAPAGRVERRIGEDPPAADLDQERRTADVGEPQQRATTKSESLQP
jgi:hypothetical protein